jgi:cyclopropane-fatty-acyl-phospholipid synthase
MMPSDDLALHFQDALKLIDQWRWDGSHYEKTANAWLKSQDAHKAEIMPVLEQSGCLTPRSACAPAPSPAAASPVRWRATRS